MKIRKQPSVRSLHRKQRQSDVASSLLPHSAIWDGFYLDTIVDSSKSASTGYAYSRAAQKPASGRRELVHASFGFELLEERKRLAADFQRLGDLNAATGGGSSHSELTEVGIDIYFRATSVRGEELWKSDGTVVGTTNDHSWSSSLSYNRVLTLTTLIHPSTTDFGDQIFIG